RDRAKQELAQLKLTETVLDQFSAETGLNTSRKAQSAKNRRLIQSQPATFRARSRSIESARMSVRSLNIPGDTMNNAERGDNNQQDMNPVILSKLLDGSALSQALTSMTALSKISSARNKKSADILDKHADFFVQPDENVHQPRLVKRNQTNSSLKQNLKFYNPPPKSKQRPQSAQAKLRATNLDKDTLQQKPEDPLTLREQLMKSLELRQSVEAKIKTAKDSNSANFISKRSDATLKRFSLSEQERLKYVKFMREVTDAILRKNLTTENAIEKLFEIHIDRNKTTLDEKRMRELLQALKDDLGVSTLSNGTGVYSSVHKATSYDNDPIEKPPVKDSIYNDNTPLSPYTNGERRRSSYDLNTPLPWQTPSEMHISPKITTETIRRSTMKKSTLNDLVDEDEEYSEPILDGRNLRKTSTVAILDEYNSTPEHVVKHVNHQHPTTDSNNLDTFTIMSSPPPQTKKRLSLQQHQSVSPTVQNCVDNETGIQFSSAEDYNTTKQDSKRNKTPVILEQTSDFTKHNQHADHFFFSETTVEKPFPAEEFIRNDDDQFKFNKTIRRASKPDLHNTSWLADDQLPSKTTVTTVESHNYEPFPNHSVNRFTTDKLDPLNTVKKHSREDAPPPYHEHAQQLDKTVHREESEPAQQHVHPVQRTLSDTSRKHSTAYDSDNFDDSNSQTESDTIQSQKHQKMKTKTYHEQDNEYDEFL
ncbi:unnamed protein product, partial [Didymodactylos carnosus]